MRISRRDWLGCAGVAAASVALPCPAWAQAWPNRSIKAMIPFGAGSSVDVVGRIVLDQLATQLGQPIYVENRGGAGGTIGAGMVAKAEPNGYTVLVNASAHSAAPAMYPSLPYDPLRDFSAVANFGSVPQVVIVNPKKDIKTLKDLMDRGKAGSISFSTAGVGSTTHWAAERLCASAGIKALHVPFRGPEALTEVVAGRVDFMCPGVSAALGFIRGGELLPLAVCTPKRTRALPDVATTIEQGYPNSDYNFWNGMLVPAKTPREIVDRLHQECTKALNNPNVLAKFEPQGVEPMSLSPTEFDALIVKEIEINKALVKAAGLKF